MESRIARLPSEVAEKIAAGEVIERPFSVVKELVDNSLDAEATQIEIWIEEGGRRLIRIQDNGCGMTPYEMHLALERHATSKLKNFEDLFSITTLGFRGEALPSIGAVARFCLRSSSAVESELSSGYEIEVEGGSLAQEKPVAHPRGTTIEVRDLFFNIPVRLKFLKSAETEWHHIEDYLTRMALAYPQVQWRAYHNGRQKFHWTQKDFKGRLTEVFGQEVAQALYPIAFSRSGIEISGFVGHPNLSRAQTDGIYCYLDRRPMRDRVLNHAILEGYRSFLMKQQFPLVVLFLKVPPGFADVNVHPAKREVKFLNSALVHQLIVEAIRQTLNQAPWANSQIAVEENKSEELPDAIKPPLVVTSAQRLEGNLLEVKTAERLDPINLSSRGGAIPVQSQLHFIQPTATFSASENDLPKIFGESPQKPSANFDRVGETAFSILKVIGQLKATYILCETEQHFVLIDQHAAHERLGYEQLKAAHQAGAIPVQHLLVPDLIELPEAKIELVETHHDLLEKAGVVLESFGSGKIILKAIPALLGKVDAMTLVHDLVNELELFGSLESLEARFEEIFATMACHRQIRAGDRLTLAEMQALVQSLDEGAYGYHCPHGRPVMVQFSFREIEKWFKRVV